MAGTQGQVKVTDELFADALGKLHSHIVGMLEDGKAVQAIQEEIRINYVANSSATFQAKVDEWVTHYLAVKARLENMTENVSRGQRELDGAEDEAHNWVAQFTPSEISSFVAGQL